MTATETAVTSAHKSIVKDIAKSTGVSEQDVHSVLKAMGLENALKDLHGNDVNLNTIKSSGVKAAIKLSRSFIAV